MIGGGGLSGWVWGAQACCRPRRTTNPPVCFVLFTCRFEDLRLRLLHCTEIGIVPQFNHRSIHRPIITKSSPNHRQVAAMIEIEVEMDADVADAEARKHNQLYLSYLYSCCRALAPFLLCVSVALRTPFRLWPVASRLF